MNRAIRFALGIYSPSAVMAGAEPMPAPTIAGRWRQWRKLRAGWAPRDDWRKELTDDWSSAVEEIAAIAARHEAGIGVSNHEQ